MGVVGCTVVRGEGSGGERCDVSIVQVLLSLPVAESAF